MKSKILSMLILASAGMLLQTAFCEDRSKLDELKKDFRSFRIRAADREAKRGYLLEPLLPFDEAADKAKQRPIQGMPGQRISTNQLWQTILIVTVHKWGAQPKKAMQQRP